MGEPQTLTEVRIVDCFTGRNTDDSGALRMRFLVVGAGALGGYFGGRLLEARRAVTFCCSLAAQLKSRRTG